MTSSRSPAEHGTGTLITGRHRVLLLALCGATFVIGIDTTIVGIALPAMAASLEAGPAGLTGVIVGYTVTFGSLMLAAGHLGDRFGHRRSFLFGVLVFGLASLLCGLAQDVAVLQAARLLQGCAAAMLNSSAMALIRTSFSEQQQGKAFGWWGAVMGSSFALGPVLGGLLVSGPGWRWMFLVNVPVCVLVGLAVRAFAGVNRPHPGHRIDLAGQVLVTGFFAVLIGSLVVVQAEVPHWAAFSAMLAVGGVVLLLVLVRIENRKPGLLEPGLFRDRGVVAITLFPVFFSTAFWALLVIFPQYFERGLGMPPSLAGIAMIPLTGGLTVAPVLFRSLAARCGARVVLAGGLTVVLLADLALAWAVPRGSYWLLVPWLVLGGLAAGIMNPEVARTAMRVVDSSRSGLASGLTSTMRQIGFGAGVAGYGIVTSSAGSPDSVDAADMRIVLVLAAITAALGAGVAFGVRFPRARSRPEALSVDQSA